MNKEEEEEEEQGTLAYGYSCYQLIKQRHTWDSAKSECQANGGHLAEIHDRWQQAFIASQVYGQSGNFWIGMRVHDSDQMRWYSNATLDYTAWSSAHTGLENDTCVSVQTNTPGSGLWVNTNCSSSQNYICESPRTGYHTVRVTTPTTTAPLTCDNGWHKFNAYCYKAFTGQSEKRSFFDARDTCRSMGTHLISIHSKAEERFAFSYRVTSPTSGFHSSFFSSARSFWIGLNDFDVEKGYKWTDGSPFDYQTWGRGEPNDVKGGDDCVDYNKYGSYWNDNNCYLAKSFVCKAQLGNQVIQPPSTVAPTPSASCGGSDDWQEYNGSCYYVSPRYGSGGKRTWYDARSYCLKQGGDLASIHTDQENGFIVTMLSRKVDKGCWLGMNDVGIDQFAWTDGTPWDYEKWQPNEPNDSFGSEKCGQIYAFNGYWNDFDCNDEFNFLCKKPTGNSSTATVPPTVAISGNCPTGFARVTNGNRCYKIYGNNQRDRVNYTSARDTCRHMGKGFDIATIGSRKEQAMLLTVIESTWFSDDSGVWIGLNDLNKNSRFTWQDSAPLTITNWGKGQPGYSYRAKCVEMYTDSRRAGKWHNTDCGNIRGYVCQAKPSPIHPIQTMPSMSCTRGYKSNGVSCYKLYILPMNWTMAVSACRKVGASLVSIVTIFEQAYVDVATADIHTPVWIGLGDTNKTGSYSWIDNWPVYFSSWNVGEPSKATSENCVTTNNGFWNDTICSEKYPFFCKQSLYTPPPPISTVNGYCQDKTWKSFGDHCYFLSLLERHSWANAESECRSKGMELASILTRWEEMFILRLVDSDTHTNHNVWIGMRKTGGFFRWSDTHGASYINWDKGEPSDLADILHEECVELKHETGTWNDARCSIRNGFVCKTPKLPATSPHPSASTITTPTSKQSTPTLAASTVTSTPSTITLTSSTVTSTSSTISSTSSTVTSTSSTISSTSSTVTSTPSTVTSTLSRVTSRSYTVTSTPSTITSTPSTITSTTSATSTPTPTTFRSTKQTLSTSMSSAPQSTSIAQNSTSRSTNVVNTLPTGFERITDKVATMNSTVAAPTSKSVPVAAQTSKASTVASLTSKPATIAARTAANPTTSTPARHRTLEQTPIPQSQGSANDMSSGQIGGLIAGVFAVMLIMCGVLLYVKRKHGDQLFSWKRLLDGRGFGNVMYNVEGESAKTNENNLVVNGNTNGHIVGFRDLSDDTEI